MTKTFTQPKNTDIKISALGEEKTFVGGNKNWRLEFADYKGKRFEPGVTVSWTDKDERKAYKGEIEWIILVDTGNVEVCIDNDEIGRLPLEELRFIKKKPKAYTVTDKKVSASIKKAIKKGYTEFTELFNGTSTFDEFVEFLDDMGMSQPETISEKKTANILYDAAGDLATHLHNTKQITKEQFDALENAYTEIPYDYSF